jgi:hypothetical protein
MKTILLLLVLGILLFYLVKPKTTQTVSVEQQQQQDVPLMTRIFGQTESSKEAWVNPNMIGSPVSSLEIIVPSEDTLALIRMYNPGLTAAQQSDLQRTINANQDWSRDQIIAYMTSLKPPRFLPRNI